MKKKQYCECPEITFFAFEPQAIHFDECPKCHKPDYGTWWASEMNKKSNIKQDGKFKM